jgi:histone acetyltransferase (RNA polymerase elongator complex component)
MNRNASLRISTRPDGLDNATLLRLKTYGVETIELGAQSMCDDVLKASGRGHTAQDTISASRLIKQHGLELILQMMTGLPGDTPEKSILTAKKLIGLQPDGVRIYPTVVIRDTKLHELWINGEYQEHTVEDAVTLCADLHELFVKAHIPIIRLGLNPTEELSAGDAVCGAYHPAFGELVLSRIFLNRARLLLGGLANTRRVTLGVSQRCVSAMTGQKRSNIEALQREFGIEKIIVKATDNAAINKEPGEIVIMSIENNP